MEVQASGAGEVEVDVSMAEAPHRFVTVLERITTDQSIAAKKVMGGEERVSDPKYK
jgi:hypothetical protein